MISENNKVRSLCIPVFKTKRSVSVNISVMILEDGAGWNAGDWFDAPSYIPCVFEVSVCSFHWRVFCTYGEVTIVVRCSKIKSDALTSF